ncbi:MAG: hypothetical protein ACI9OJ_002020 [Myxococcota bacterium]
MVDHASASPRLKLLNAVLPCSQWATKGRPEGPPPTAEYRLDT